MGRSSGIDGPCVLCWAGAGDADARGDQVHEPELHRVQVSPDQGAPVAQGRAAAGVAVGLGGAGRWGRVALKWGPDGR